MTDYRRRLLDLRAELDAVAETAEASAAVVELDQSRVGRLSRMDAMQAQAMSASSNARRAEMHRRIEAALRRLEAGDYGICKSCDEPIDPKRLEFDPTAVYCIDCASRRGG